MQSIYFLVFLLSSTCGLPVRYDQRQDGELNVHAHLENFIIVFIPGSSSALSLLDIPLKKNVNHHHATGVKLSAPDFPAAKSPYKVDIDKSEGEVTKVQGDKDVTLEIADEVMIAHVPAITITKHEDKIDSVPEETTTQTALYEESTQKMEEEPAATEKVEKEEMSDDSEKKENTVVKKIENDNKGNVLETEEKDKKEEKTEEKVEKEENKDKNTEEKVEKEEKKDEKTDDKDEKKEENMDNVPVIDVAPGKTVKSAKSISVDFGIEAARPGLQRVRNDEVMAVERAARVKASKIPEYRHDIIGNPEFAQRLKRLRTGINECQPGQTLTDDGQCVPAKLRQRTRSFASAEDRMLPILQFGLSPANSD